MRRKAVRRLQIDKKVAFQRPFFFLGWDDPLKHAFLHKKNVLI